MRLAIMQLTEEDRDCVRQAVRLAVRLWPNAHLGDISPREDMREAFRRIRRDTPTRGFMPAVNAVLNDAENYRDC